MTATATLITLSLALTIVTAALINTIRTLRAADRLVSSQRRRIALLEQQHTDQQARIDALVADVTEDAQRIDALAWSLLHYVLCLPSAGAKEMEAAKRTISMN